MSKFLPSKHALLLVAILFIIIVGSFVWQFSNPVTSKAQTSYSSINCPTPEAGKSVLQLVPCTPAGAISPTSYQAVSNQQSVTGAVSPVANNGSPQSGPVCTPDSSIGNGASCNCPSDLEPDAMCTVPSATICSENGGVSGVQLGLDEGGFLAMVPGYQPTPNPNGSTICLWLDSAPVPAAANATNCSIECNSKPVLYFYSPTSLSINVSINVLSNIPCTITKSIPCTITKSIPSYTPSGWQNVIIHPTGTVNGTLEYNNNFYKELYYEDATVKAQPPTQGFVIKTSDLTSSLKTYTTELGLNTNEQNEFIAYWVPKLRSLNAPYIFFSVFDQTQKERVDNVVVSPAPTTTIAFLAYFKPLPAPINVPPLQFAPVPTRQGFTMIEWGGTIDESN